MRGASINGSLSREWRRIPAGTPAGGRRRSVLVSPADRVDGEARGLRSVGIERDQRGEQAEGDDQQEDERVSPALGLGDGQTGEGYTLQDQGGGNVHGSGSDGWDGLSCRETRST